MTDKEILIDGVNVRECNNYAFNIAEQHICREDNSFCDCKEFCYFKQLAREKQNNKNLENEINALKLEIDPLNIANGELVQEVKELFEKNKELKQKNEELKQKLKTLQIQDDENIVYEVSEYEFDRANKYEQALRNIKKFVETFCGTVCQDYIGDVDCEASCNAKFITEPILDDINEVLNDKRRIY